MQYVFLNLSVRFTSKFFWAETWPLSIWYAFIVYLFSNVSVSEMNGSKKWKQFFISGVCDHECQLEHLGLHEDSLWKPFILMCAHLHHLTIWPLSVLIQMANSGSAPRFSSHSAWILSESRLSCKKSSHGENKRQYVPVNRCHLGYSEVFSAGVQILHPLAAHLSPDFPFPSCLVSPASGHLRLVNTHQAEILALVWFNFCFFFSFTTENKISLIAQTDFLLNICKQGKQCEWRKGWRDNDML